MISVLVPTHKRPKVIHRALTSLEAQTILPDEVIIIGNGMDKHEFAAYGIDEDSYRNLNIIMLNYPGFANLAQALQFGLACVDTDADYVAVLEDDDEWRPEFVEKMSAALDERPGIAMAYCDELELDYCGIEVDYTGHPETFTRDMLLQANWIHFPVQMWRYKTLVSSGGFAAETSGAADWDIALRMSASGVCHVKEVLAVHHWLTDRFSDEPLNNCLDPDKMKAANMWIDVRKQIGVYG